MHIACLANPRGESRDMIIATVPWTDSAIPLMAPAALLPIVERAGLSCLAVDLNIEIYQATKNHPNREELIEFFFDQKLHDSTEPWLRDMFLSMAQSMLSWKPRIIGLSLFSYVCQSSARWLAYFIKKLDPTVTILIGGAGCLKTFTGPSDFVSELLDSKLVDYHIRGDGEHALYEFLIGNDKFAGINSDSWQELTREQLERLPMPDYRYYDLSKYDKRVLPLVGSRGCVRRCTFCDYIANWKKFQWRTADDIFAEMLEQSQKYDVRYFKFQDSLTNGNMKEFIRLTEMISQYNQDHALEERFRWSGYYIFREITASSEKEWRLLSESGAENLSVGIENLNERIRYAIGKKFSNASIDFHLAQAQKYGIQLQFLNIVGYVDETEEDIDHIKSWLVNNVKYRDILYLQWGGTLGIFPNTYLERNQKKLGIRMIGPHPQSWINDATGSDPATRSRWVKELNDLSRKLGYRVADNIDNHFLLETLINA